MKTLNPPGRLVERLLYILSNYNFVIEHKKSEEIPNVDYLTRDGCNGNPTQYELEEEANTNDLTISAIVIQQGNLSNIDWKDAQGKEENLKKVRRWKEENILPTINELKKMNTNLQRYAKNFDSIKIDPDTNILLLESAPNEHLEIDKQRILIPEALHNQVIHRFHRSPQEGHFATEITASKILNHFWMPRIYTISHEYIARCLECHLKKKSIIHQIKPQRSHMYTNITNYPLAFLYLDHYGPLPKTGDDNEYILTARVNFTRYVCWISVKDTKSITVIKKL